MRLKTESVFNNLIVTIMKKVFMSAAVVAMMIAAVSCQCNGSKKAEAAEEAATEECEGKECEGKECEGETKECCKEGETTLQEAVENAADQVKDAAKDAAANAIDNAAQAAKDALNK